MRHGQLTQRRDLERNENRDSNPGLKRHPEQGPSIGAVDEDTPIGMAEGNVRSRPESGDSRADRIGAKGPLKGDEQLKGATRSEAATESEIAERRVSARVREAALLQSERPGTGRRPKSLRSRGEKG